LASEAIHGGGRKAVICGVDFDNTVVQYDGVLAGIARERGLIDRADGDSKRKIRDRIRKLPNGEIEWQRCQALLYGSRIGEARLAEGALQFLKLCNRNGVKVYIVSHKTEYSRYDTARTNLRKAAREWMAAHELFGTGGLAPQDIFFADTRREKIERITTLHCTHFIDDLEETFLEKAFPSGTTRILYEPGRESPPPAGVRLMTSWQDISEHFFGRI